MFKLEIESSLGQDLRVLVDGVHRQGDGPQHPRVPHVGQEAEGEDVVMAALVSLFKKLAALEPDESTNHFYQ